ncbi:MAG: T9SS type B sorting domain-containing protein [Thermonemataceae bacterium]|nr:T9SS type B sorting domain-containing protein [Thermonemataceae bacterium]
MKKLLTLFVWLLVLHNLLAAPSDTLRKPAHNTSQVPENTRLQLFFNDSMQKGSGNILLYDASNNNLIFTIPVSSVAVSIDQNKVVIQLPASLSANQTVYVKIATGVFKNMDNENFVGFLSSSDWRFSIASGLVSNQNFSPSNNSACISINQNTFQLQLSTNVAANTNINGKIYIYEKTTNVLHESISVNSSQVITNGTSNIVTFVTSRSFIANTVYYILIDPMSFVSSSGSIYEGIYDNNVWAFRTSEDKPITENIERCGAGEVLLKASYSRTDVSYRWYKTAAGGEPIRDAYNNIVVTDTLRVNVYQSDTYYVSAWYNACESKERATIIITVKPAPESTLPPAEIRAGKGTFVTLEANGGETYSWQPIQGLSDPNIANPVVLVEQGITYTVTISNPNACSIEKSVKIIVDDEAKDFFLPTVFSPNNDGVHDVFRIMGKNISEVDWTIYDQYGKELYRSKSVLQATTEGWDGSYKGQILPNDLYIWTLRGQYADGSPILQKSGSVLLVR